MIKFIVLNKKKINKNKFRFGIVMFSGESKLIFKNIFFLPFLLLLFIIIIIIINIYIFCFNLSAQYKKKSKKIYFSLKNYMKTYF